jgi:CubicO group peptidase (beta-lactamase class C family)/predicted aspartyl protease
MALPVLAVTAFFLAASPTPADGGTPESGSSAFFDAASEGMSTAARTDPATVGLEASAVEELVREAERSRSSALVLIKDDKVVVDRTFDAPGTLSLMSVTKSIVSLAIGLLIAEHKIASVDSPLSTWFPEWKSGPKGKVTLRHVLMQTSGLDHEKGARKLYEQADVLQFVRKSALTGEPGKEFSYSNEAVQLLSGVIAKAAGKPVDVYLDEKLFKPLGIKDWSWDKDKAGNVRTFADLALPARGLAKIGQLMLRKGNWQGKQLLPAAWIQESTSPRREDIPWYGYLWWAKRTGDAVVQTPEKLDLLRQAGFQATQKLAPLTGKTFEPGVGFWLEAGVLLQPDERAQLATLQRTGVSPLAQRPGSQIGFYGNGWLGQYVVVYPKWNLVAVRMHRPIEGNDDVENKKYGFDRFMSLVEQAVVDDSVKRVAIDRTPVGGQASSGHQVGVEISSYQLVFVPVRVNGTSVRALVDTGSYLGVQVSQTVAKKLGLPLQESLQTASRYGQSKRLLRATVVDLGLGKLDLPNLEGTVSEEDIERISQKVGTEFDVILGWNFLSQFNIALDLSQRTMTLGGQMKLEAPELRLTYEVVNRVPVARGVLGGKPVRMLIDTGAPTCNIDPSRTSSPIGSMVPEEVELGGKMLTLDWRVKDLGPAGKGLGVDAVLGNNFFVGRRITFDSVKKEMLVSAVSSAEGKTQ